MDIVIDVLKWIVVILIAGFIGQFGKSLSQQIDALNARFRHVEGDPLMSKVKNILLEHFRQKAGEV